MPNMREKNKQAQTLSHPVLFVSWLKYTVEYKNPVHVSLTRFDLMTADWRDMSVKERVERTAI